MFRRALCLVVLLLTCWCLAQQVQAQSLNGQMTGTITDNTGSIVVGAQVKAENQGTGAVRKSASNNLGVWLIPQLPPGTYKVTAETQGFETVVQSNVLLNVNGSVTINFQLKVGAVSQTVTVSTAPPLLNTTSATLSTVVGQEEVVDLPLNGREFSQLALLSPGESPVQNGQQGLFTIAEGAGGVSPSSNGQRGEMNSFTLDGVGNNALFDNSYEFSPPPDAIQEFNVQAHMTDAQFGVSAGANINVQTRAGTNSFHGDVWEYDRNDDFDALTYPNSSKLLYHQNQYGLFVGGPIVKNHTFFSGYWEGYRFSQLSAQVSATLTGNEIAGNYSGEVGTTPIGTDDLCRPMYANELYDANSTRMATATCGPNTGSMVQVRDPFPTATGSEIPGTQVPTVSSLALDFINVFYPSPNMNVAEGVLPNYEYPGLDTVKGDQFGARFDQQLSGSDSAFVRLARNNIHNTNPGSFPTFPGLVVANYGQEVELGYTHVFNPRTILNVRAAYNYQNLPFDFGITSDPSLVEAMGTAAAVGKRGGISPPIANGLSNGYSGIFNLYDPLGPTEDFEYHIDATKTIGHHTVSGGGQYFHLRQHADVLLGSVNYDQAGTSYDGLTDGATGFGPASFVEDVISTYSPEALGTAIDMTAPWWAFYGEDQWQVSRKLVLTFGTRWDYVGGANLHTDFITFDGSTNKVWANNPSIQVPASFLPVNDPTLYEGTPGYYTPRKDGWEPRFGATYGFAKNTVGHVAFAVFDAHDNQFVQTDQNLTFNWPNGTDASLVNQAIGIPLLHISNLPSITSLLSASAPAMGFSANRNRPISYAEEYNAGVQQQLANNLVLNVDYVGSVDRHQFADASDTDSNTAEEPGPGNPQLRAEYPQYGPIPYMPASFPSSYNALQAKLTRPFSSGATFTAAYTWSKALDILSDPEGGDAFGDWYNPLASWGPALYNVPQMFVFSGVYQLPFGKDKMFLNAANQLVQSVVGGWQTGGILSIHSGTPFTAVPTGDVANTGWNLETAQRGSVSPYHQSGGGASGFKFWLTPPTSDAGATALPDPSTYAFTDPLIYTLGNERRHDLKGPGYKDVDFDIQKNFPIWESVNFQFRTEFFNIFNHTNYGGPAASLASPSSFGEITGSNGLARVIQFSGKINF